MDGWGEGGSRFPYTGARVCTLGVSGGEARVIYVHPVDKTDVACTLKTTDSFIFSLPLHPRVYHNVSIHSWLLTLGHGN